MIDSSVKTAGSATARPKRTRATDCTKFFTPAQIAGRWGFHTESVRRLLRRGSVEAVVLGRRLLVPVAEVERIENEGRVARAA